MTENNSNELTQEQKDELAFWGSKVAKSMVIKTPDTYHLDWDKVTSIEDIKLLLQLHFGHPDKDTTMSLYPEQYETYKHLIKDEDRIIGRPHSG